MKKILLFTLVCASAINSMEREKLPLERRQQLQEQLEKSAFRKGISVGIQGTMKIAPSDHLPITVTFNDISIVSWNLLSDDFIWNYFRDVGEKPSFAAHKREGKALDWRSVLNNFGNFVFNNSELDKDGIYQINITPQFMKAFITEQKLNHQKLQESTQNEEKIKRSEHVLKDEETFVNLVLNTTNPDYQDVKTSLIHAIEIKYAITQGYLLWEKRFAKIIENRSLVKSLTPHNFFCFQECTNPQDMFKLLQTNTRKNLAMLTHAVEEQSKDNCVIIYDKNKYKLEEHISFGLASNSKPCIIAKFNSLNTNTPMLIGSVHHSGRGKSEMSIIMEKVNSLLQGDTNIPVLVLGDYNHQIDFYKNDIIGTNFDLKMPSNPTMAGLEHGNLNKAIDGVLTNRPVDTTVKVLDQKIFASQVTLPIEITFEL